MPAAGPKRCANPKCEIEFVPRQRNQRFHSRTCQNAALYAVKRKCVKCAGPLASENPYERFCSKACKWSYLVRRSADSRKRTEPAPEQAEVTVLPPLGCKPKAHPQVEDPEQMASVRKLLCRRYERCLAHAAKKGWAGFHCRSCDVDETLKK